jgi:hypothetical protein
MIQPATLNDRKTTGRKKWPPTLTMTLQMMLMLQLMPIMPMVKLAALVLEVHN